MSEDMQGKVVSEAEAAEGLGFANVYELRRWQTVQGHKVVELEYALQQAKDEASRFQWHGKRMQIVLEKAAEFIRINYGTVEEKTLYKMMLAIEVVCGKGVDWRNELLDWLPRQSNETHRSVITSDRLIELASELKSDDGESGEYDQGLVDLVTEALMSSTLGRASVAKLIGIKTATADAADKPVEELQERWVFCEEELQKATSRTAAGTFKCRAFDELIAYPPGYESGIVVQRNGLVTNRWSDGCIGVTVENRDDAGACETLYGPETASPYDAWRAVVTNKKGEFIRFVNATDTAGKRVLADRAVPKETVSASVYCQCAEPTEGIHGTCGTCHGLWHTNKCSLCRTEYDSRTHYHACPHCAIPSDKLHLTYADKGAKP